MKTQFSVCIFNYLIIIVVFFSLLVIGLDVPCAAGTVFLLWFSISIPLTYMMIFIW